MPRKTVLIKKQYIRPKINKHNIYENRRVKVVINIIAFDKYHYRKQ